MRKLYILFLLLLVPIVAKADFPDFDVIPRGDGGKVNIRSITSGGTSTVAIEVDPTADTVTVNKTMTAVNAVIPYNYIINGNLDISQRGDFTSASGATHAEYTLDRMQTRLTTVTANVQHLSTSQPSGVYGSESLRHTATSTGSGKIGVIQPIEDLNYILLQGEVVTLSAWVKSNDSNARIGIYDGSQTETSDAHTGGGSWEFLSVTYTLPTSMSAMSAVFQIMSSSDGSVSITSGDYFEFTRAMLNKGGKAYPFVRHGGSFASELAACQRYYQKSYPVDTAPDSGLAGGSFQSNIIADTSNQNYYHIPFPVTMRATPTAYTYSTVASQGTGKYYNSTDAATNAATVVDAGTNGFSWRPNSGTNQNIGDYVRCQWTAEAEL